MIISTCCFNVYKFSLFLNRKENGAYYCSHYASLLVEQVEISYLEQWLSFPFFILAPAREQKTKQNVTYQQCSLVYYMFSHLTSIILNISFTVLFFPEIYSVICFQFFSGYIKNFEVFDPHRVGKITVELQGRIKDCKALTYRQDLRATEIEKYRTRMLPTRQVFFNSYLVQL